MDYIYWINKDKKVWMQFIQNRVQKIRSIRPDLKCPGTLNPVDIPSRHACFKPVI